MARLLDRAAALANQGLFFEVHELLEPAWFRAADPVRTALQGLIQVAVAFHHLENGNHEGALARSSRRGWRRSPGAGAALPLDATGWLGELRAALRARSRTAAGTRAAAADRRARPRPVTRREEIRWRSC